MITWLNILIAIKFLVCVALVIGVVLAPAYLARVNGKKKYDMVFVRMSSWVMGWTGVGWLLGLFWGARKASF